MVRAVVSTAVPGSIMAVSMAVSMVVSMAVQGSIMAGTITTIIIMVGGGGLAQRVSRLERPRLYVT